ncbi:MAG TPA: hypothetical protein VIT00_06925 [Terrimicrobiaceae bacterium]
MNERTILDSMREVLRQGETLLGALDDASYAARIPAAFNSSVGGHYRHCLDHFRGVLDGLDAEEVNYDNRRRDPRTETVRGVALSQTRELLRASEQLGSWTLGCSIKVRSKVSYAIEESPSAISTVGREIMFCVVHAIHHYALIRVMCGMLEVVVPDGFGVAPSTIKHLESAVPAGDRNFRSHRARRASLEQRAA